MRRYTCLFIAFCFPSFCFSAMNSVLVEDPPYPDNSVFRWGDWQQWEEKIRNECGLSGSISRCEQLISKLSLSDSSHTREYKFAKARAYLSLSDEQISERDKKFYIDKAKTIYEGMIDENPNDTHVLFELALFSSSASEFNRIMEQILSINPTYTPALLALSDHYLEEDDSDKKRRGASFLKTAYEKSLKRDNIVSTGLASKYYEALVLLGNDTDAGSFKNEVFEELELTEWENKFQESFSALKLQEIEDISNVLCDYHLVGGLDHVESCILFLENILEKGKNHQESKNVFQVALSGVNNLVEVDDHSLESNVDSKIELKKKIYEVYLRHDDAPIAARYEYALNFIDEKDKLSEIERIAEIPNVRLPVYLRLNLAEIYEQEGRLLEAIKQIEKGIVESPQDVKPIYQQKLKDIKDSIKN